MNPLHLLLVEDNPGDIRLTQEALRFGNIPTELQVVCDGEAALHFLRKEAGYQQAVTPDIILLDLNLPKINGREVLETMRQDDKLKEIPVIVLTTSADENDILRTHHANANCYITKPFDFTQFLTAIQIINQYQHFSVKK